MKKVLHRAVFNLSVTAGRAECSTARTLYGNLDAPLSSRFRLNNICPITAGAQQSSRESEVYGGPGMHPAEMAVEWHAGLQLLERHLEVQGGSCALCSGRLDVERSNVYSASQRSKF